MPSNDLGYVSHFPVLAAMLADVQYREMSNMRYYEQEPLPVLELGMGWGSTPLLHAMCHQQGRALWSVETDKAWYDLFEFFARGLHTLEFCRDWTRSAILQTQKRFAVAFIDCAPGEIRKDLAVQLKDRAEYIVLHDALSDGVHGGGGNYQYESILPQFKHHAYYRVLRPATLVLSNFHPIELGELEMEKRVVL